MSAIEKTDLELPLVYISPELVSSCLSRDDSVADVSGSVAGRQVRYVASPSVVIEEKSEDQDRDYFSRVMNMLILIIGMMGDIADNSSRRAKMQSDISNVLERNQETISANNLKELDKQIKEANKRKSFNLLSKIFGGIATLFIGATMAATGNFAGAFLTVTMFALCASGAIDKLTDRIVADCMPNATENQKLGIKIGIVCALSILMGSVGGLGSGATAALTKVGNFASVALKSTAKYAGLELLQMVATTDVGSQAAEKIVQLSGASGKTKEILSFIVAIGLMVASIVVDGAACKTEVGAKVMNRVTELAATSKHFARLDWLVKRLSAPKTMYTGMAVLQVPTFSLSVCKLVSDITSSDITKEQGSLQAAELLISRILDMLNEVFKQGSGELKSQLQALAEGNERLMGIAQPIAYAASVIQA